MQQNIVCNLSAIDPAQRDKHTDTARSIFNRTLEIRELAAGYGFRLPLETPLLYRISEWIANERLCCPFFTFKMVVAGELWLELSGTDEVKRYIQSIIVNPISETGQLP